MTSINPKARTCFVFPDGEGGQAVKITDSEGGVLEYCLDLNQALRLTFEMARAAKDLAKTKPPEKHE